MAGAAQTRIPRSGIDTETFATLGLRVGSQASVTVYTGDHPVLNPLCRLRMQAASYLTYAY